MCEWISIDDKLPDTTRSEFDGWEESDAVICACKSGRIAIAQYCINRRGETFWAGYDLNREEITHWMTLPKRPEDTHDL